MKFTYYGGRRLKREEHEIPCQKLALWSLESGSQQAALVEASVEHEVVERILGRRLPFTFYADGSPVTVCTA